MKRLLLVVGAALCLEAGTDKFCFEASTRDALSRLTGAPLEVCDASGREKAPEPRINPRVQVASATRAPWIVANGWRFARNPGGKYWYELPAGKAVLAMAEAFAYGVDAGFRIDPKDHEEAAGMLKFLRSAPPPGDLPPMADFALVDDGSALAGEAINLLCRRNLLFEIVRRPDSRHGLNVVIGSDDFPRKLAANPSELAAAVREKLTDERRSVRLYGSEMSIVRASGDGRTAWLAVINYGNYPVTGIRLRVRGIYRSAALHVFAQSGAQVEELVNEDGFTEFTIPEVGPFAVVDLRSSASR